MKRIVLWLCSALKKVIEWWASLDVVFTMFICCGSMFDVALVIIVGSFFVGLGGMLVSGLILLSISLMVPLIALTVTDGDLALAAAHAFLIFPLYATVGLVTLLYGTITCRGTAKRAW